jgi:hypothetical protein
MKSPGVYLVEKNALPNAVVEGADRRAAEFIEITFQQPMPQA